MINFRVLFATLCLLVLHPLPSLAEANAPASTAPRCVIESRSGSPDAEVEQGFRRFDAPRLQLTPWRDSSAYNFGHDLMLPMLAAFELGYDGWLADYCTHFSRFVSEDQRSASDIHVNQVLPRLHYIYLASEYVRSAVERRATHLLPAGLPEKVFQELNDYFLKVPTWWYQPKQYPNYRARIVDRMAERKRRGIAEIGSRKPPNFYDGFADDAAFVLAGLANMSGWAADSAERKNTTHEAARLMLEVLETYGEFRQAGYLFQAGQWSDHPDYAHASHLTIEPGLKPAPRDGLPEDSSHGMRWAKFLDSTRNGLPTSRERGRLDRIQTEFARMFYNEVLTLPSAQFKCYRLTNYLDGWNGLYRYGYSGRGDSFAYGPYGVSNIIFLGWWPLLPPPPSKAGVWDKLPDCFPLGGEELTLYYGPGMTSEAKERANKGSPYVNGWAQMRARLFLALTKHRALVKRKR